MDNANKAVIYLAVIDSMIDTLEGTPADQGELVDTLAMLGFDPQVLLYETPTLKAFQLVCKAFADLPLTGEDLLRFSGD